MARRVRSRSLTTETLGVGMRRAKPVKTPFKLGMTLPTARAAPVLEGITFMPTAPRPPRQSLEEVPSTTQKLNRKTMYHDKVYTCIC